MGPISSREELIGALEEASELEHGLMLQYMFAALSMKKRLDEGLTGAQQELVRDWESRILAVMREEMAHLGTVCNLLSAIGGAPRFGRPNFPQAAREYYPFSFMLLPFSDEALHRFIRFELPKGERPPEPPKKGKFLELAGSPVPEPLEYQYVGELYGQIDQAFATLPEKQLFIGPRYSQDTEDWSRRMQILRVVDRATANAAIDFIVREGEGAPGRRQGSHYETFLQLRSELAAQPEFAAARPVVPNPRTRPHRDAPLPGTLLTHADTIRVAELFNACYEIALLMLVQLYSHGGETLGERDALRSAARQLMTMAIRPIGEILTEMPATGDPKEGNAGATFELYTPLSVATQMAGRWVILGERLDDAAVAALALTGVNPRLGFIAENLQLIKSNLERTRAAEDRL
jgi:Ferritin-like